MSVIEDVRKVIQDLVAPELQSLSVEVKSAERESRLRDESLAREAKTREELNIAKLESLAREAKTREELILAKLETQNAKMEALTAKMDAQYASIMYSLNLDKRVESLEREKQSASA